jgi:hypothetical protein
LQVAPFWCSNAEQDALDPATAARHDGRPDEWLMGPDPGIHVARLDAHATDTTMWLKAASFHERVSMSRTKDLEKPDRERDQVQSGKLHEAVFSAENSQHDWSVQYGYLDKAGADQPSTALVAMNGTNLARFVRDEVGVAEGDKIEEIAVGVRPVLRGFRYGGNIRISKAPKLFNCDALEVYVDGQRFTLPPGSDMEVRAASTARMEVQPMARSTASIEQVFCTFYGKP